ncbi:hypothetical protein ACJX0J_013110 [Zea mays]
MNSQIIHLIKKKGKKKKKRRKGPLGQFLKFISSCAFPLTCMDLNMPTFHGVVLLKLLKICCKNLPEPICCMNGLALHAIFSQIRDSEDQIIYLDSGPDIVFFFLTLYIVLLT